MEKKLSFVVSVEIWKPQVIIQFQKNSKCSNEDEKYI